MNKQMVLEWLIEDTGHAGGFLHRLPKLKSAFYELNNRKEEMQPPPLPQSSSQAETVLREHFRDDVTRVSLYLSYHFPGQYLFYRVSKLEEQIFAGFDFLAEVVPEFSFPFARIGRTGFDRYLQLNQALLGFARRHWPSERNPQLKLAHFLYQGLGRLFLQKNDYNRYWVMLSRPDNFGDLDSGKNVTWSGRKEMQAGDLVFMYRTSPRKAITDIYRVQSDPDFDPWGAWDGFWVDIARICRIEDIPFAQLRADPVLSQWGVVRKQFTGTITDPVPHSIYNRLLELMPEETKRRHNLKPEPVAPSTTSGQFSSEEDFEKEIISPLLRRWGFKYQYQYPCRFRVGSQDHNTWVDFFVSDERGPLTLFEDKLRIISDSELQPAVEQGKSYALMLGLPSFVVASPEAIRVYSLQRNQETLVREIPTEELPAQDEELRFLLSRLRE